MPLPTLKVALDNPLGKGGVFELDGHDISKGLTELSIQFKAGEVVTARLTVLVGELDIDAPTLAVLEAHVKATQRPPEPEEPDMPTFGEDPPVIDVTALGASSRTYIKSEEPCHAT